MKYGYSYIRFSTPSQAAGDSLRRQTELTQKYADEHSITLDDTLNLRDLGVSAFHNAHAATGKLGAFLQAVEEGRVKPGSFLLIENLDRLTRANVMEAFTLFARIVNYGITIVTLSDNKQYTKENCSDISNILFSIFTMVRAHDESLQKSKRLTAAWANKRNKASQGHVLTHNIPAWLRIEDGKILPIPERVALVQRIFSLCITGLGTVSIARKFNQEGVESWVRANGWYPCYIRTLLCSRRVLGEFTPHKKGAPQEPIPNYYPPIRTNSSRGRVPGHGRMNFSGSCWPPNNN